MIMYRLLGRAIKPKSMHSAKPKPDKLAQSPDEPPSLAFHRQRLSVSIVHASKYQEKSPNSKKEKQASAAVCLSVPQLLVQEAMPAERNAGHPERTAANPDSWSPRCRRLNHSTARDHHSLRTMAPTIVNRPTSAAARVSPHRYSLTPPDKRDCPAQLERCIGGQGSHSPSSLSCFSI